MLLNQRQAKKLLNKYYIKFVKTISFQKIDEIREKINFPAVLKIDSPEVLHKTELGLVFMDIDDLRELKKRVWEAEKIIKVKGIKNYSFILQEQLSGIELIMGMKRDKTFGTVILFGLGGILTEVIEEVSTRIAPLKKTDCENMIEETKAKKLLGGFRNLPQIKKKDLVDMLLKLSEMSLKETEIKEIDFNPLIANDSGLVVVDARVIKNV